MPIRSGCHLAELSRCSIAMPRSMLGAPAVQETKMKNRTIAAMSVDQLWCLHEEISAMLTSKMDAEKRQLERRLAQLHGSHDRQRRPYPKVLPKYQNPERPFETWSGRGRQPHWVGAQLNSGKKFGDLLVPRTH
jgi:DNA-binding protein H-NS